MPIVNVPGTRATRLLGAEPIVFVCASFAIISAFFPPILFWLTRPSIVNFIDEAGNCSFYFGFLLRLLCTDPQINISFATMHDRHWTWQMIPQNTQYEYLNRINERMNEHKKKRMKIFWIRNLIFCVYSCTVYSHGHPTCWIAITLFEILCIRMWIRIF